MPVKGDAGWVEQELGWPTCTQRGRLSRGTSSPISSPQQHPSRVPLARGKPFPLVAGPCAYAGRVAAAAVSTSRG